MPATPSGYPVALEFQGENDVQNRRPLVNWLLVIPHFIVLWALGIAAGVLWFISFFTVLFTKKNPFVDVQTMILRLQLAGPELLLLPPQRVPAVRLRDDTGTELADPAVLAIEDPGEMNRWLPLVKWLLVIPHFIVLSLLWIGVFIVHIIAFFAVLFTGRWPEGCATSSSGSCGGRRVSTRTSTSSPTRTAVQPGVAPDRCYRQAADVSPRRCGRRTTRR